MVTAAERGQIEAMLGPLSSEKTLHAVRDGRGRQFQRMEFLGDSVLDVILAVHVWAEPQCPACLRREATAAASDLHLAEAARRAGLGEWLEWRASDERIADLVETCVAACWQSGRWEQAARFASQVVHPVGDATVLALNLGAPHLEAGHLEAGHLEAGHLEAGHHAPGRVGRRAGSALLELAAGYGVVHAFPDADEGELSTRRATIHRATVIAVIAKERGLVHRGDPEMMLSAVEDQVAAVLAAEGADAALLVAQSFVPVHSR